MIHDHLITLYETLYEAALAYPEAWEDHPWGDTAIKVRKKIFVFLGSLDGDGISFTLKLPSSAPDALLMACATPTGYGLGKSGWVTFRTASPDAIEHPQALAWLDESYRAVAPKTLIKQLG